MIGVEYGGFVCHARKITSCGCIECSESGTINIDGEVYVDGSDDIAPYLELTVHGLQNTTSQTVDHGTFEIEDLPTDDVVIIKYEPEETIQLYQTTLPAVHIVGGARAQKYIALLRLIPKRKPPVVDLIKGAAIDVGDSPMTNPALKIYIPPGAMVDVNDNLVRDNVHAFVSFCESRIGDGLAHPWRIHLR